MGFVAICTAIYDYSPQGEGELEIREGELLYVLEKGTEDDWWKAKKRAEGEDEDEPEGLIPNNYVEDAKPINTAKALYDYSRQTDEEVSFSEDATLDVYDTSDSDWTLVGVNGDFGFAPANYIELSSATSTSPTLPSSRQGVSTLEPSASPEPSSPAQEASTPAANLARVLGGGMQASPTSSRGATASRVSQQETTPEASDGEEAPPALPQRPASQSMSLAPSTYVSAKDTEPSGTLPSPPYNRTSAQRDSEARAVTSPGGYHLYNISEMVSAMGRRRKLPIVLGLNVATGTIMLSPENTRDGASQEWTADRMTHYSIEGKHIFLELIRPSKSLDLHAGSKNTAEEIVSTLGEIAGAQRGEGLKEIMAAASGGGGLKKGQVLYDFMAQGDDEVTVAVGDEVIILDDTKSEEWWNVRRLKNGKEGMVPNSYIEVTGILQSEPQSRTGINAVRSTVDQNRLEEERLTREAAGTQHLSETGTIDSSSAAIEVGPGMKLPQRGSSLAEDDSRRSAKRDKRLSRSEGKTGRSKPDPAKTRTWTDHSGSFKVEAQFIGLADGKIHLHKQNGVKIAVPASKMSPEDIEYVEKMTNESLEDYLPVALVMERKKRAASNAAAPKPRGRTSLDQGKTTTKPEYDWFDFFLQAGVGPHQCERYAQSMIRDSMDESVLADISPDVLRTLGLKEGDVLKVMKFLDQKLGRARAQSVGDGANGESARGIFSGPGGTLYNNTRRGRPDVTRQTSDVVDPKALQSTDVNGEKDKGAGKATPLVGAPKPEKPQHSFDDDAWDVKPSVTAPTASANVSKPPTTSKDPPLIGSMAELSLLTPLEPSVVSLGTETQPAFQQGPSPQQTVQNATTSPSMPQQSQKGASPSFFSQLPSQPNGTLISPQIQSSVPSASIQGQAINPPRQRPQPPPQSFSGSALLSPPPRPLSAPQNPQSQFGLAPLQPQLTGFARPAPPGQSLEELNQQRLRQQYLQSQLQSQPAAFQLSQGFQSTAPPNGLIPQMTGLLPQQQQPYLTNGNAFGSPFADPGRSFLPPMAPHPTGFGMTAQQGIPSGGINSILPPALQPQQTAVPQRMAQSPPNLPPQNLQTQATAFQQPLQMQYTGMVQPLQPQSTGFQQLPSTFGQQQNGVNLSQIPPVPPIPQQPTIAPLQPQKTGPAPFVRFGVSDPKKLAPQPTGKRANLSNATPDNPFGF